MSIGHSIALSYLPLGESLIAQVLPLIMFLVFIHYKDLNIKNTSALSILLFTIPLVSISYIFAAGIIYAIILYRLLKIYAKNRKLVSLFKLTLILIAPYALLLIYVLISDSSKDILYDIFTFNSTYYAPMLNEPSGGVINVLINMLLRSMEQVSHVLSNILNPEFAIQNILLLGFLTFSIYLYRDKKVIESAALLFLLPLINTRTNIFNKPAITSSLSELSQHASIYISVAILASSIGFVAVITNPFKYQRLNKINVLLICIFTLTLISSFTHIWYKGFDTNFTGKTTENYLIYSRNIKENNVSKIINNTLTKDDYAWIGSADFTSQLYLEPKRATEFTFYLPWIDSSPKLSSDFLTQLQRDRPKIIYFVPYKMDGSDYQYNASLLTYLEKHYYQYPNSKLKYYYFDKSHKDDLTKKLKKNSYLE
jgi:hypothetical protein